MRKKSRVALWIGAGVLVLGGLSVGVGPLIYADHLRHDSDAPLALAGASDPPGAVRALTDLSGTWTAAAGSTAGYRVGEVLYNQHVTVTGRTTKVAGSVTADGLTLKDATFTVDVDGITTPEPARDAYFRGAVMQADRFPKATFTLTGPAEAKLPAPGEPAAFEVKGRLTLRGVTRPVTVPITAALTPTGGQVTGRIPIAFSDFGVQAPSLGFVTVEKSGSVEFLLNLTRK